MFDKESSGPQWCRTRNRSAPYGPGGFSIEGGGAHATASEFLQERKRLDQFSEPRCSLASQDSIESELGGHGGHRTGRHSRTVHGAEDDDSTSSSSLTTKFHTNSSGAALGMRWPEHRESRREAIATSGGHTRGGST